MNGTPRLRSAFPSTPRSIRQDGGRSESGAAHGSNGGPSKDSTPISNAGNADGPLIPLAICDAPTQRFYISSLYLGLTAWRLFDYSGLLSNDSDSLWLFMKWVAIDGVFLYGMPGLRIPWLEWSSSTMTILFLLHALVNGILMFRIPIPLEAWIMAFARMVYDRELSVSEGRVRPASLLQNPSLILGKQIIHILPEGSAMLNPNHNPFCIGAGNAAVNLPILVNQSTPISIDILRVDFETNVEETITINSKEAKRLKKQADKNFGREDSASPRILHYPVKKTGLYRLLKVVDESNLEVQCLPSDTLVVSCPSGSVRATPRHKCRGELSDFYFQIDATPPLKVRYSKIVNREDQSHVFLTVHPETSSSPLLQRQSPGALAKLVETGADLSWARTQRIDIPVNETLGVDGGWKYSLDEIHDGCGNVVNYTHLYDLGEQKSFKGVPLEQVFLVHERPKAVLNGCSPQNPMKVAKGGSRPFPVWLNPTGPRDPDISKHSISYSFTPQSKEGIASEDERQALVETATMRQGDTGPEIREPGLYSLLSVSNEFCDGEVLEPSSCLLLNPPEPDLSITSEDIPHQCAGNSVGLRVSAELTGTPPFQISFNIHRQGDKTVPKLKKIEGLRTQLEFKPLEAGLYTYEFVDIMDAVYRVPRSLKHKELRLEQDVKPTAWARFLHDLPYRKACIQEPVSFDVVFSGEAPWTLEYDLIHDGKRKKFKEKDITSSVWSLYTPNLNQGGQYILSLTSVTDKSDCRIFLDQEAKIDVRLQRPTVSFGQVEGKRHTYSLQGQKVNLPVRLSGEPPWTISYLKTKEASEKLYTRQLYAANDVLEVDSEDIYEIKQVHDRFCPGTVDAKASKFEISWIPRPAVRLAESSAIERRGDSFHKMSVCAGDQDYVEVGLTGNPPFSLRYDVHFKPGRGAASISNKEEKIGSHSASIKLQTSQPGAYDYRILELGDQLYDHDRQHFLPLVLHQIVHSQPSAKFVNGGRTYNYCKEGGFGDEVIPIALTGEPPFAIEMGIKHHATTKVEIVTIPHVENDRYDFRIPHSALSLGSHFVTIRKVRDSNGCQKVTETDSPLTRVNVVDVPSISPMEPTMDFCVGDRITYTLAGVPPFNIYYLFEDVERKASTSTNNFRRIAERPGNFTITAISDKASSDSCRAHVNFTKIIHELPSVRISKGKTAEVDIHEGGEAEMLLEFGGTPPFEFTYTRSTNAMKGKQPRILETKTDISHEHSKIIKVSDEGTYEVVSVRDKYCGVSSQKRQDKSNQHLLTFR